MKKLGRSAYLLEVDGVPVVLKAQPAPPPARWRHLLRRITGGSLPYQNELKVTPHIASMKLGHLAVPQLIGMTDAGEALYSILPGSDTRDLSVKQKEALLHGLLTINLLAHPPRFKWWKEGLFLLLDSPLSLTIRRLWKAELPQRLRWRAIMLLLSFAARVTFSRHVFLHNDLVMSNVLASGDESVGLIDFEDAIYERRFVLADAVDIAFDSPNCRLDLHWLRDYAKSMAEREFPELASETTLQDCIHACLLRNCAHRMISMRLADQERKTARDFVVTVLLDRTAYLNWLKTQDD